MEMSEANEGYSVEHATLVMAEERPSSQSGKESLHRHGSDSTYNLLTLFVLATGLVGLLTLLLWGLAFNGSQPQASHGEVVPSPTTSENHVPNGSFPIWDDAFLEDLGLSGNFPEPPPAVATAGWSSADPHTPGGSRPPQDTTPASARAHWRLVRVSMADVAFAATKGGWTSPGVSSAAHGGGRPPPMHRNASEGDDISVFSCIVQTFTPTPSAWMLPPSTPPARITITPPAGRTWGDVAAAATATNTTGTGVLSFGAARIRETWVWLEIVDDVGLDYGALRPGACTPWSWTTVEGLSGHAPFSHRPAANETDTFSRQYWIDILGQSSPVSTPRRLRRPVLLPMPGLAVQYPLSVMWPHAQAEVEDCPCGLGEYAPPCVLLSSPTARMPGEEEAGAANATTTRTHAKCLVPGSGIDPIVVTSAVTAVAEEPFEVHVTLLAILLGPYATAPPADGSAAAAYRTIAAAAATATRTSARTARELRYALDHPSSTLSHALNNSGLCTSQHCQGFLLFLLVMATFGGLLATAGACVGIVALAHNFLGYRLPQWQGLSVSGGGGGGVGDADGDPSLPPSWRESFHRIGGSDTVYAPVIFDGEEEEEEEERGGELTQLS
jgi:hypothetical protein